MAGDVGDRQEHVVVAHADDDGRAPGPDAPDAVDDGGAHAGGVEEGGEGAPVELGGAGRAGQGGAQLDSGAAPSRDGVGDDHLGGAEGPGDLGDDHADRAGAGDEDGVPDAHARLADGGDADAQGLQEGAGVEGHGVGDLVGEVVLDEGVLAEAAVDRRGGVELDAGAEVVLAALAVLAHAAAALGLDGDPSADAGGVDVRAGGGGAVGLAAARRAPRAPAAS